MEKLSSSLEDYLEAIYNEVQKNGFAKVTDIAKILNVKKASVTGALNSLTSKKLINYAPYSSITLTEYGEAVAKEISQKHQIMADFFANILLLPPDEAALNACKMEHIMSEELFTRITKFSTFIQKYSDVHAGFQELIRNLYK